MLSTDSWLKVICGMQINAILFGIGAVTVLSTPALNADAEYWLPAIVIGSFVLAPLIASKIYRRMRLRYWQRLGRQGDFISD